VGKEINDKMGPYVSTQSKNGSDEMNLLLNEEEVNQEVPELANTTQPMKKEYGSIKWVNL